MSGSKGPKQQLFGQLTRVAQWLASDARLGLPGYLAQGERSVDQLAQVAGLSLASAFKHLQQLNGVGLVEAHRIGKQVLDDLADDRVPGMIATLRVLAESHMQQVSALVGSQELGRITADTAPSRGEGRGVAVWKVNALIFHSPHPVLLPEGEGT